MASKLENSHNNQAYFGSRVKMDTQPMNDDSYIYHLDSNQRYAVYQIQKSNIQECDKDIPISSEKLLMTSFQCGMEIPHIRTRKITFEPNGVIDFTRSLTLQTVCDGNSFDVLEITTSDCEPGACHTDCTKNCPDERDPLIPVANFKFNGSIETHSIKFPCRELNCELDDEFEERLCCPLPSDICQHGYDCPKEEEDDISCNVEVKFIRLNGELRIFLIQHNSNGEEFIVGELGVLPPPESEPEP